MGGSYSKSSSSKTTKKRPGPGGEVSQIDRAVLDLKVSRDRMTRYKQKLNLDSTNLLARAKTLKHEKNDSKNALNLLKLRKMKLKEVDKIDTQLLTIQTMVSNIRSKEEEKEVLAALRTGKDALQKLHEENTLEDVLNLMDGIEEQNELEREINVALVQTGENVALSIGEEEELENELLALMGGTGTDAVGITDEDDGKIELPVAPDEKLPEVEDPEPIKKQPAGRVAVAS